MAFLNMFKRERVPADVVPADFNVAGTVYAIGDLHGMPHLLDVMLDFIVEDAPKHKTYGPTTVVFMGDYVDRGEDSKGVLERLSALKDDGKSRYVFLRGNHDAIMIDFIDDPVKHHQWLEWGGVQTLASFGVPPIMAGASEEELKETAALFSKALGDDLRHFVEKRTKLLHQNGNVLFCHAAVLPDRPIENQPEEAMMWGSRRFMEHGGPPGRWTVHGHTIVDKPQIFGNRIAIDTGAYATGILSGARITNHDCKFIVVE